MNTFLTKIKTLSGRYDLITDKLYSDEDEQVPITDVEGTTALLTTDGTSWEYVNGNWSQTDENLDTIIAYSIFPFIMSVDNSTYNDFINICFSKFYDKLVFSKNVDNENFIDITGFTEKPLVQAGDIVRIARCHDKMYLSEVQAATEDSITIDNRGLNIRIVEDAEVTAGICLVEYPPDYIDAVLNMFIFDLFERDDKEKRQERLGNYTYTNFEPTLYYGDGSYPKYLEETISYWQHIYV